MTEGQSPELAAALAATVVKVQRSGMMVLLWEDSRNCPKTFDVIELTTPAR
jgi:hypothetical protein